MSKYVLMKVEDARELAHYASHETAGRPINALVERIGALPTNEAMLDAMIDALFDELFPGEMTRTEFAQTIRAFLAKVGVASVL